MNDCVGAPVRVRRVSAELQALRRKNGLGAEEVARALGFSMSKLSRMENGRRGLNADDVSALLGVYRVPARRREELLSMVRSGSDRNWWQVNDGRLPTNWEDLMRFESEAVAICNWEPVFGPGLLQTDEYAETIIRCTTQGVPDAEISSLVAARMSRQSVLLGADAPELHVLLDEMILRRTVGGRDMFARQLSHLASVSRKRNVTVRVVPLSAGVHPGWEGPFLLLEFPKHRNLVFQEYRGNNVFLEEPAHIAAAKVSLRRLRELALLPEDSVDLIGGVSMR